MLVYTSITKSYLPKARVLAKSVKSFHPEWTFVLLFSDDLPAHFDLAKEPFDEVLMIHQLPLENWRQWAFGHSIVELCTAVKGMAAEVFAARPGIKKIMYLDPDTCVFDSLSELDVILESSEIILTPHLLVPERRYEAILDNEVSTLKHGIFNLGFFAARTSGQGLDFIKWWSSRLIHFCEDNIPNGLFTDQKWCDLAPAFFSRLHILRDPGYNVATWNIEHRPLSFERDGRLFAGGNPLRFYHFTSYDNGNGLAMLQKYARDSSSAKQVWENYGARLEASGQNDTKLKSWSLDFFENGERIPMQARRAYRHSRELQKRFPDPYTTGAESFYFWWKNDAKKFDLNLKVLLKKCLRYLKEPLKWGYVLRRCLGFLKN